MKRKLLFLMTLVITAFTYNAKAQTDVTSTYLTNADFEGEFSVYSNPQSNRAIYQPNGWTVAYSNGDSNDMTALNSTCLQWNDNFANKPQPTNGDANTYWIRFRWGSSESLQLSQTVTLPAGQYSLSADAIKYNGSSALAQIFIDDKTTTITSNSWNNYEVEILLAETKTVSIGFSFKQNSTQESIAAFDNFKLTYTAVVIKDALEEALAYATRVNTELSSSDLATAISTAQGVYDSASATQDDVNNAVTSLKEATATAIAASGLTDITFVFENGDFSSTDGWEAVISGQYRDYGNGLIGTSLANYAASTTDATHSNTDYYLANECRWNTNYSSFTQSVLVLPAGNYSLSYDVENTNSTTTAATYENRFFVKIGETTIADEATEWMNGATGWTTHTVYFTLDEPSEITVSLGYGTGSNNFGTANTPVLYTSHLKLNAITDDDVLAAAQAAWQEAHDAAVNATENGVYDNISGAERTALNAEIAKAEPKTVEGYEEATAALIEATNTFTAAKPSYDELAAEIAYATTLEVPTTEAQTVLDSEETTATTAVTATEALKVLEYTTLKEGYTYDASAKLGDWTVTGFSSTTTGQHWNGQNTQYFDQWNGSAAEPSLIQSVTLPAGEYLFMAAGRGPSTSSLSMTVNETTVNFKMKGDTGKGIDTNGDANFGDGTYANNNNGRGWEWRYVIFTLNEETEVSFAINGNINNSWVSVTKEMNLYSKPSAALSKEVLAAVLEQANGVKDDAANVGDAAFQIPTAPYNTFVDAIASGQAVYDNSSATIEQVDNAVTALENAIEAYNNAELNAPAAGQVFNIINVSEGFNFKDHPVSFKSASDADLTANTTTMGWAEEVASIYPQDVTFTAVEGVTNGYTLSYTRADGNTIYVGTGSSTGLGNNNDQLRPTSDATKALTVKVEVTKTDGVWKLYNTLASKYMGSNGDQGFYTSPAYSDIKIQEAAKHNVSLNILAANKYGTITLPFDVAVPDGVVAYSTTELDGNVIVLTEVTEMKANTPYILFAEAGAETTLSGYGAAYTDATYTSGLLTGAYVKTIVPTGSYVLQNLNDYVAFYKVTETEEEFTMPAYRAYLTAREASGVKTLNFGPADDATGISAIEALTTGTAEIYNAAGVRVNKLEKGVNIIRTADGKTQKVLVK